MINAQIIERSLSHHCSQIDTVDDISFEQFLESYMFPNKPVLVLNVSKDWTATKEWLTCDPETQKLVPDVDAISRLFGSDSVCVAHCNDKYFSDQKRSDTTVNDYIVNWKQGVFADECKVEYLKDWHLFRDHPEYPAYITPPAFIDDWINRHWKNVDPECPGDDYRFVYLGPKGSWTPLHRDVFRSFSWSANVCGTKEWLFFPPSVSQHLINSRGECPYDITKLESIDRKEFPNIDCALQKCIKLIQPPCSAIFVPSLWFHQVRNVDDCLSINHNWGNACNVDIMWNHLVDELIQVERALNHLRPNQCECSNRAELTSFAQELYFSITKPHITSESQFCEASSSNTFIHLSSTAINPLRGSLCTDCLDWSSTCQNVLKASAGINFPTFGNFLHCCVEFEETRFHSDKEPLSSSSWSINSDRYIMFGVEKLAILLTKFRQVPEIPMQFDVSGDIERLQHIQLELNRKNSNC